MFERIESDFKDWLGEIQDSDVTTFEEYYQQWEDTKDQISTEDSFSTLLITGIVVVGAIYILRNKIRKSKNPIIRVMRACNKAYRSAWEWTSETYQDFKEEWNAQEASTEDASKSARVARSVHAYNARQLLANPVLNSNNATNNINNFSTEDIRHYMSDIQPQVCRQLEHQLESQIALIKGSETGFAGGKLDTTSITSDRWKTGSLHTTITHGKSRLETASKSMMTETDLDLETLILSALSESEWTRNEYIKNIEAQHALVDRIAKYSDELDKEFIVMAGEIRTERTKNAINKAVNDVAFIIEQNLKFQADIVRFQNNLMIRAFGEMLQAQALLLTTIEQNTPEGVSKFKAAKKRHDRTRDVIRKLTKMVKEL